MRLNERGLKKLIKETVAEMQVSPYGKMPMVRTAGWCSEYSLRRLLSESLKGNPRRKSEYYTKLMTLMKSEESFFQAESLFEMVQDTMLPEEVTILRAYFDTVDLARELYNAWTEYKIARDQAWENLAEKREVYARVQQRFNRKLVTVEQLLYHKKVYRVVVSISSKIIDGKL